MAYSGVLTRLPGVVPAGLAEWQASIRGLTLGQGTSYHIIDWGEQGSPEVRTTDEPRAQQDGNWLGVDTYGGQVRTMSLYMRGATATEVQTLAHDLMRVWRNDPRESGVEFWLYMPGMEPLRMLGRPRRIQLDRSRLLQGRITATLQFESPFPALYTANSTSSIGLPSTSGTGRSYDLTYNRVYNFTVTGGGQILVPNSGTYDPLVLMQVAGGLIDHTVITNETTGEYIDYDYQVNTPNPGDEGLIIDHFTKVITHAGTPSRFRMSPGSSFFSFPNGEDSVIRFQNVGFATTPQLSVTVAQAYLG